MIAKIKMLSKFPPGVLLRKIWNKLKTQAEHARYLKHILPQDPRTPHQDDPGITSHFIDITKLNTSTLKPDLAQWLLDRYSEKRFDLLGSGWVHNKYHSEAAGLETLRFPNTSNIHPGANPSWLEVVVLPAHVEYSKKIWNLIQSIEPDYEPIDWQRDFKSGFRWDARKNYSEQRHLMQGKPGIDLKVPWELSRLQHLPQMAILAESLQIRKDQAREYLCQTLDFMMTNPIGMGVNFNCPMDIGIRVANMLMAFDLFRDVIEEDLMKQVEPLLAKYVLESCRHIAHDMEYREGLTSNHYLGNVLGILFGAAWLDATPETDQFLAFGVQELQRCMDRQFFADGSNFEGSTSYHRLSGEMMAMGCWLVLRFELLHRNRLKQYQLKGWKYACPLLPPDKQVFNVNSDQILSDSFFEKLLRSAVFSKDITKPSGRIPQFGDNDSGRFFRFTPCGSFLKSLDAPHIFKQLPSDFAAGFNQDDYWDEDALNHQPFTSFVNGLFGIEGETNYGVEYSFGTNTKFRDILNKFRNRRKTGNIEVHSGCGELNHIKTRLFELWSATPENLDVFHYPDFQLAGIKGSEFYLALVGMSNPNQHHSLSHVHNDKLHLELEYKGKTILRDPGTYLYTPIPDWRIKFRSVHAHNAPIVNGEEQNRPLEGRLGLFNMMHDVRFTLETCSTSGLTGVIQYRDIIVRRKVELTATGVLLTDSSNKPFEVHFEEFKYYSPGYGKRTEPGF